MGVSNLGVALTEDVLTQGVAFVLGAVAAALLQLGNNVLDEVLEGTRGDVVRQVDAVQATLVDPALQLVSNLNRVTNNDIAHAAEGGVLSDGLAGPLLVLRLQGEGGQEGLNRLGLHVVQNLVLVELGQVNAGPAADDSLCRVEVDVLLVLLVLCLCLLLGLIHDDGEHCEDLDVVAATALLLGSGTDTVGHNAGQVGTQGADEHSLSVLTGELLATAGCASLENHGGALRARLSQGDAGHGEVLALVANRVDLGGVSVDAALAVLDDCAVFPGTFPQLVADVQELVGDFVAFVVRDLGGQALVLSSRRQVRSHNVEPDAALSEVVEGGVAASQSVGLLESSGSSHTEAEVLGHCSHCRNLGCGVIHGNLSGTLNGGSGRVLVHVVDANNVSDEHGVKQAALKGLSQVSPVLDGVVLGCTGTRVTPEVEALVTNAGHFECVNYDALLLLSHRFSFRE